MISLEKKIEDNPELIKKFNKILVNHKPHFNESLCSESVLNKISQYGKKLANSCTQLCVVGLGGSSLGARALYEALDADKEIIFFDNIDAYSFEKKFQLVDKDNCHWLFTSKSGSTREVLCLIDLIVQKYDNFNAKDNCTVVTDDKPSSLLDWCKKNEVDVFNIPLDIGGRYSVFTPVGLLPLAYMGKNLNEVVQGVDWALNQKELIAQICSGLVDSFKREEWVHLYWIYSDCLQAFGLWLQQLWMESLGKKLNLDGEPAPRVSSLFTARGASDQHSILQQINDGVKDKFITFLSDDRAVSFGNALGDSQFPGNNELSGFGLGKLCLVAMQSTYEALAEEGVSTNLLFLNEVNTKSLSALMSLYMVSTVVVAEHLKINPFDQPGVESSKLRTKAILSRLSKES